jgi:hypothetical protein
MTYCLYVDNEIEEEDLELEDALDLEAEILEEDPEVEVRVAPMNEDEDEYDDSEDDVEGEEASQEENE